MSNKYLKPMVFSLCVGLVLPCAISTALAKKPTVPTICEWMKPALSLGKSREFKGWMVYNPAIECKASQLAKAKADQSSPESVLVKFFGDLMHQRKSWQESLSPTLYPGYRKALEKGLLAAASKLRRVIIHARISAKRAPTQGGRFATQFSQMGHMMFGSFDHFVFIEGNTSRDDMFVYLEKTGKRWYIKGFQARFLTPLFKGMKKPWWPTPKRKAPPTSRKFPSVR